MIVSYSDGEGRMAGVGAAAWVPWLEHPVAVFSMVPDWLRAMWAKCAKREQYRDIFLVEGVGPLLLLIAFPRRMRNALWIHFIDNEGSEASLVKGSSSMEAADHVVGLTWEKIAQRCLTPYFGRVESEANPVDKLSRGDARGPWREVVNLPFPTDELKKLADECGGWLFDPEKFDSDDDSMDDR